jgi:hypothetical protein
MPLKNKNNTSGTDLTLDSGLPQSGSNKISQNDTKQANNTIYGICMALTSV